jgi:hypothetical protein
VLPPPDLSFTNPKFADKLAAYGEAQLDVHVLRLECVGREGYGSLPETSARVRGGTSCAVRADGKPLPKEHLEALCHFIKDEIEPELRAATAGLSENDKISRRDEILNVITEAEILRYYENFKKVKIQQGHSSSAELPSLYDIKKADLSDRVAATLQAQRHAGFEQQSEHWRRRFGTTDAMSVEQIADAFGIPMDEIWQ